MHKTSCTRQAAQDKRGHNMVLFLPTHNPMTMRGYLMYYTKKANHTHTPKCESHTQSHVKSTWNLLRIGIAFSVQDVISPGFKERVFVKSDSLDLHWCFCRLPLLHLSLPLLLCLAHGTRKILLAHGPPLLPLLNSILPLRTLYGRLWKV
jgi:hypothetical protein